MVAAAVTEPGFGSDVAGIKATATKADIDGQAGRSAASRAWCTLGTAPTC